VHAKDIPTDDDVDLGVVARGTPGFSGADLANLVNEAALLAARKNRTKVAMEDFEESKDKVMMGTERRSMIISDEEKRNVAYHEAGHALVAKMIPGADPIHKVTIIPRGRALGLTQQLPEEDRYVADKDHFLTELAVLLGGRAADETVFNMKTTGAGNDITRATDLARKMVCEWGMSEGMGPLTFGKKEEQIFLGREIAQHRDYSERTAIMIDEEVKKLVDDAHNKALKILKDNLDILHHLAEALLENEVIDGNEVDAIIRGEKLPPPNSNKTGAKVPEEEDTAQPEETGEAEGEKDKDAPTEDN
jgi:cell division protease FtsH